MQSSRALIKVEEEEEDEEEIEEEEEKEKERKKISYKRKNKTEQNEKPCDLCCLTAAPVCPLGGSCMFPSLC